MVAIILSQASERERERVTMTQSVSYIVSHQVRKAVSQSGRQQVGLWARDYCNYEQIKSTCRVRTYYGTNAYTVNANNIERAWKKPNRQSELPASRVTCLPCPCLSLYRISFMGSNAISASAPTRLVWIQRFRTDRQPRLYSLSIFER